VTFHAKKRDRIVAGHFTSIPASLFSSKAWEALSPTALRLFGFMAGADASVHSGDGRVGFSYDDFVERGIGHNNIGPALRELVEAGIISRVWKGHGGEKARASSVSFYRLTTYAADGPQAFLKPLTRAEWMTRLAKARAAKDLHHAHNGKKKYKMNVVRKERNVPVPETGTGASPRNGDEIPPSQSPKWGLDPLKASP
jgi:hypothetical protein